MHVSFLFVHTNGPLADLIVFVRLLKGKTLNLSKIVFMVCEDIGCAH